MSYQPIHRKPVPSVAAPGLEVDDHDDAASQPPPYSETWAHDLVEAPEVHGTTFVLTALMNS